MSEARKLSSEALEMMRDANLKTMEADNQVISKRNNASAMIQEERSFHSKESATLRRKMVDTIDKLNREQEASVKKLTAKSNKRYEHVIIEMNAVTTKLMDERIIWQKHLSELDVSSKNRISKEREHRRCSVQQ